MRYSIEEAKVLFQRWKDSASITRIVFCDVATGGAFTGLIRSIEESNLPPPMELSVEFEVLLPNGIRGSSLISVNFWGTEEMEFTDFTDDPPASMPVPDLEHFNTSLAIQYEIGSMLSISEVYPSPALETLRGTKLDASQVEAMLKSLNERKND